MKISPYSEETIYDLAIRLYGNLLGLGELVGQVDSIDDPVSEEVTFIAKKFDPFIESADPPVKRKVISLRVGSGQSIYDLAIQSGGKIEGIATIISRYSNLDDDLISSEIVLTQNDDELVNIIQTRALVFATKDLEEVISNWILALGAWNDSGIWIDNEIWNDG